MVLPVMSMCENHVLFIFASSCLLHEWNHLASFTKFYVFFKTFLFEYSWHMMLH